MDQSPKASSWAKTLFKKLPAPSSASEERVYAEMQRLMIRLLIPMAVINFVNGLIYSIAFLQYVEPWRVALWFTPVVLFSSMQALSAHSIKKRGGLNRVSVKLLRKAEATSLVLGVFWGASAVAFYSDNDLANLFICVVIAGMSAGTVSILGPVARVGSRFLLGSVPVMLCANIVLGSPFALEVTLLALSFTAALIIGGLRNYKHVFEMVDQSIESERARQRLADAIESSNDAFAFYDDRNELLIANARHRDWFDGERPTFSPGEDSMPVLLDSGRWLMRSSRSTGKGGAVVVHTDITALKTRERELIEAQREAVEADESKSRFLSTMSHELRTPMNIILGFSKLMTGESKIALSPDDVREYADNIHASGTHLLKLINDIIDYSKVGLERMPVHAVDLDTSALLSETITLAAGFEDQASVDDFDVSVSAKLRTLHADETAMKRILINLVSNAIRFNEPGKKVVIRAGLDAQGAPFIAVRDFGPGIPESKLEKVFEAFYQADGSFDREHGGTGLGLTLCRHLARLMSGDVVLKSRVGVGTTAILSLPPSAVGRPSDRPMASDDEEEWIGPADRDVA
ncbi:sensor histidine kinase [Henriciella marina]|uniref:sensor histidine kinase n=1 Tax=Henriciella marina TaxID=453851 RepID=UPI0003760363|nr:ATP-binding protein [Henriciella marina]